MTVRRKTDVHESAPRTTNPSQAPAERTDAARPSRPATPIGPLSREEAEAAYAQARDVWVDAMHHANGGRPADLASLAIAQEAYEAAAAELELWRSGARIAIPIHTERSGLDAIVQQQLAWKQVLATEPKRRGPLGRLFGRLSGRR